MKEMNMTINEYQAKALCLHFGYDKNEWKNQEMIQELLNDFLDEKLYSIAYKEDLSE